MVVLNAWIYIGRLMSHKITLSFCHHFGLTLSPQISTTTILGISELSVNEGQKCHNFIDFVFT
jgi:hypothetical protein